METSSVTETVAESHIFNSKAANVDWKLDKKDNLSHEHLIDEDTHPPPVHCAGVVVVCQDLGSQKLRSPAESRGAIPVTHACGNCDKGIKTDWLEKN